MGVLLVSPATEEAVRQIRAHAEAREHWYHAGMPVPGDDPRHVIQLGSYHAVFSWTVSEGKLWRHLSVSAGHPHRWPEPIVAWTIATMFGFTGGKLATLERPEPIGFDLFDKAQMPPPPTVRPGPDWKVGGGGEYPGIVIVAQEISGVGPPAPGV